MAGYKTPDFNERAAAARAAKQSALDQLRNKAAPDPAVVAARQAAHAKRQAAAAERRAARELALREAKAAKQGNRTQNMEESGAETQSPASPERSEAEMKAARDAKYAARKSRKR